MTKLAFSCTPIAIMPTLSTPNTFIAPAISDNLLSVSTGFIDLILNKEEAEDFILPMQSKPTFLIFAHPGACPIRTVCGYEKGVTTKTQKKTNSAVAKKDKANAEVDKKHVVAARKAEAQAKKWEKLEGQAHNVAARAKILQALLADVAAPRKVLNPSMKESCAHILKKSKGIGGETAVPSAAVLVTQRSPQQKSAG